MVDSVSVRFYVSVRFKNASMSKNAFKHSYIVECGNRLRVTVLVLKTLACLGVCVSALLRQCHVGSNSPWDLLMLARAGSRPEEQHVISLAHRNRSDFCDLRLRCPSRTPEIAAIFERRESNAALRFKGAMESR